MALQDENNVFFPGSCCTEHVVSWIYLRFLFRDSIYPPRILYDGPLWFRWPENFLCFTPPCASGSERPMQLYRKSLILLQSPHVRHCVCHGLCR